MARKAFAGWRLIAFAAGCVALPLYAQGPAAPNAEEYGAWSLLCPDAGGNGPPCALSQVVAADPQGHRVALGIAVLVDDSLHVPRIEFRFSAAAVREAGIGLLVGEGRELRLPIAGCDREACVAGGRLDPQILELFRRNPAAKFAFALPGDQQAVLPVSFVGFAEGLAALNAKHAGTGPLR